jgi:hypothetical protein
MKTWNEFVENLGMNPPMTHGQQQQRQPQQQTGGYNYAAQAQSTARVLSQMIQQATQFAAQQMAQGVRGQQLQHSMLELQGMEPEIANWILKHMGQTH